MKNNKTCICCGTKYRYCPHCYGSDSRPRWMNLFHNDNCRELFHITSDYLAGNMTSAEAKEAFSKCDLSYQNDLNDEITKVLKEVNESNVTKSNLKKPVTKEVTEKKAESDDSAK